MLRSLKKLSKWGASKNSENQRLQTHHMIAMLKGVLEEILFWKKLWLSLSFILFLNVLFLVCLYKQINVFLFTLCCYTTFVFFDAFEMWLKCKHRTTCLMRLSGYDCTKFNTTVAHVMNWMHYKWSEYMYLRETNHTKAFILMNIVLGVLLIIGKYLSGYLISYFLCMLLCTLYKVIPPIMKIVKKIQQSAESDIEFDGLIPEVSDVDIKLLSIEPESDILFDEKQSLDYWKPDDLPIEEASDSSENSSSLVTNLSMEKMETFEKNVETSDSSEDEYIPIDTHKRLLQSTVEIIDPTTNWSSSAYNALWNITGAVTNMIYAKPEDKRQRVESIDSSDGFEMVDKHDLM